MKQGVYVAGKPIAEAHGIATHQFIVLVPEKDTALANAGIEVDGNRAIVLSAFNIGGYLRARKNDGGDVRMLQTGQAEVHEVRYGMCYVSPEQPITQVIQCYEHYRAQEGRGSEIPYPSNLAAQFDSSRFNSNSWAQSCIFWSLALDGAETKNDFGGIDLGRDRLIPRRYFRQL